MVESPADDSLEEDSELDADASIPGPRHAFKEEVDRAVLVAEAKLLVEQLADYLEMLGVWAMEGVDEKDAE